MSAAGCVGVGEFIDQHNLRPTGDDPVKVHFVKPLAFVLDSPARDDFEAFQEGFGFLAAVRLDDADDDVVAVVLPGAGLQQHFVGLADARRRTHENSELAATAFFPSGSFEQGLRRRSLIGVATLICHWASSS